VAEKTFYKIGLDVDAARQVIDEQLANAIELARFTAAHIYAAVLGEPAVMRNRAFVESLDLERLDFTPEAMRVYYAEHAASTELYPWKWNPDAAMRFLTPRKAVAASV
jgi:hypothetical protein